MGEHEWFGGEVCTVAEEEVLVCTRVCAFRKKASVGVFRIENIDARGKNCVLTIYVYTCMRLRAYACVQKKGKWRWRFLKAKDKCRGDGL